MPNLQHLERELSGLKQKAIEDARKAQAAILNDCAEADREPPPYLLSELIGKGSYGRVYKASDTRAKPPRLVAVKIISIEEGDTVSPRMADTFKDILREVNTLKLLSSTGAKNINFVLDTILVGPSVWIITEYCAGGSVASLMRPTGGLPEKWIIPILREVAEALFWVHRQGIIHRDIKCANVLVTDAGGVQLCDFGVAGIMETKFDKRSTVTGTIHWMAPELFDAPEDVSYGMEVDIWAFGSLAYEVASGLPPNATANIALSQFGSYLKHYCPRLEGDKYSDGLKDLVAFCMVEEPSQRPRIEEIQQHRYLFNTQEEYPTESLAKLVSAYRLWEAQGGIRRSLFCAGGAQGSANETESRSENDEWDFGDNEDMFLDDSEDAKAVYDAYGVSFDPPSEEPTVQLRQGRRRRPPKNMPQLKAPLEKVFDPNTLSSYGDNTRAFYGLSGGRDPSPPRGSDLPLRSMSQDSTVRESLIDLDASGGDTLTRYGDAETIRPVGAKPADSGLEDPARRKTQDWTFPSMTAAESALEDPERRKTQDWTFAAATPAAESPDGEPWQFFDEQPAASNLPLREASHSGSNSRSERRVTLTVPPSQNRGSTLSLIDLDASLVEPPLSAFPFPAQSHAMTMDNGSFNNPSRASNASLIDLDAGIYEMPRPATADPYVPPESAPAGGPSNRDSSLSLINLDEATVDDVPRPSTAWSTMSPGSVNESTPFDLEYEIQTLPTYREREPSMYVREREPSLYVREPSMYVAADGPEDPELAALRESTPSPTSSSPPPTRNGTSSRGGSRGNIQLRIPSSPMSLSVPPSRMGSISSSITAVSIAQQRLGLGLGIPRIPSPSSLRSARGSLSGFHGEDRGPGTAIVPPLPPLPSPPSATALQGNAAREELKQELQSMIASLNEHLQHAAEYLSALPVRQVGASQVDASASASTGLGVSGLREEVV
ncbi:hypothetical protein QBC47DRAFT_380008 [Echria macrotheca]|uniref:non-specific serine/threonine protein kinase n=1 Tax=Echria macrotheca TaxID=438768 RepID=A0AAJ0BDV6_9PEZI|nr:hypothetical protein QBC47DRAFT_380008 [Echria macrotheca]